MLPARFITMTSSTTRRRIFGARSSAVAIGLVMVASLSGCSVGPKYQSPSAPVPTQFKESSAQTTQVSAITPIAYSDWWRLFNDPVLDRLEKEADAANQDIRLAVPRVDQAEAAAAYSASFLSHTLRLCAAP